MHIFLHIFAQKFVEIFLEILALREYYRKHLGKFLRCGKKYGKSQSPIWIIASISLIWFKSYNCLAFVRLAWYVILACKVNNLIFDTQMMRLGVLQPARITLWASTNCPSSKARVTSVNSLSKLTRWSWQAPAHPLKTSWILRYTWERPPMTGRSTPTLLSIFLRGQLYWALFWAVVLFWVTNTFLSTFLS